MFSTVRPKLNLNFAQTEKLDPRLTFGRAAAATYFDKYGVLRLAPAGVPRFDHDPITKECRGLLMEESSSNYCAHSADFSDAAWSKLAITVSVNALSAPDGTTTADMLVETAASSEHRVSYATGDLVNFSVATASVFMKAGTRSVGRIMSINKAGVYAWQYFDLATGTLGAYGGVPFQRSSITPVGNGWYRCTLSFGVNSGATTPTMFIGVHQENNVGSYTGDGSSGLYVWGAQFEPQPWPTSYIPTNGATATRQYDSCYMDGANFADWFNGNEGTMLASFERGIVAASEYPGVWCFRQAFNAGSTNTIELFMNGLIGQFLVRQANNTQVALTVNTGVGKHTVICSYKQDDYAVETDSQELQADTAGQVPTGLAALCIGGNGSAISGEVLGGHIKRLIYWDQRLPNLDLKALT